MQQQHNRASDDFITICRERGLINQVSDANGLAAALAAAKSSGKPLKAYIGFDATAPSFHVGHLIQLMLLQWWQKCGNVPIIVMGGGTTLIGDPSGKDSQRKLLSRQQIAANITNLQRVLSHVLTFEGANAAIIVNNYDWLAKLRYVDLLREVGPHFSIARMLTFESIKQRLQREQNLSLLEFNYMILQAYDFLTLARQHDCIAQFGGSDQWGNIICGIELNRRSDRRETYGMTTPLITLADGRKMGKSEHGAIWLNRELLPDFDFWQFWRNCSDLDIARFLLLFTARDKAEIEQLTAPDTDINAAKILLASDITSMLRGVEAARTVEGQAKSIFSRKQAVGTGHLPTITIKVGSNSGSMLITELFVQAGLAQSRSAARRLITGKGARVQNQLVQDVNASINWQIGTPTVVAAGKKKHLAINWQMENKPVDDAPIRGPDRLTDHQS